jgi:hypothetical protein
MATEAMKAWRVSRYAADALHMADHPMPEPGANQLLLKVGAVSLNYRDKLAIEGELGTDHPLPFVPAPDAAGIVAAVGSNAHRFKVGERITTHVVPRWLRGKVLSPEESPRLGLPLPGVLVALRLLNEPQQDEHTNLPFSSRSTRECYRVASERFGWAARKPEPRSMRDGQWLIGWGMATAVYHTFHRNDAARRRPQPVFHAGVRRGIC